MRDLIRHFNQFQTQYRGKRRKEENPQAIHIARYNMDVKIPVTVYDPKSLKRKIAEPVQEACYSIRPMSKKQIYKLDRKGVIADAKAFNTKDLDAVKEFKPYGKNTPNDRKGKALLRRFLHGALLPGMMSIGEWRKLKDMGVDLQ
jgi:hypothetical protein